MNRSAKRAVRRIPSALATGLVLVLAGSPLHAAPPGTPATPEAQAAAQQHFQKARDLYQAGSYRDALAELEAARALDPSGKDLVFNVGVVCEKLGRIDDALGHFRMYVEMEGVTAQEKARAESFIKRLEGAKRELPPTKVPPPREDKRPPPPPPEKVKDRETPRGRLDALTYLAGGVGLAGLAVGTTFGVMSLSTQPSADFLTGRDGTYADLKDRTDRAHTQAVVADVGFAVGAVGAIAAAFLYLSRPKMTAAGPITGRVLRIDGAFVGPAGTTGGACGVGGRF